MPHDRDRLLREAIESIAEAFVIYDAEDRFVLCNDAYRRLYAENAHAFVPGARYEDIMRSALAVGRYPEAKGREEEWLAEWMRQHHKSEASVESQLKDGRWVLVSERLMPSGGVAGLRIDITALKTVEKSLSEKRAELAEMAEELRRGKDHLQRAQRISRTGSIVRDLRRPNAVEFSQEMYRLLGLDPAKPLPTKEGFLGLLHPDDRAKFAEMTQAAEQGRATDPFDCRVIRPDGGVRWLHNVAETLFDDDGKPIGRIATFTDVTEMRASEIRQKELERSLRMAKDAAEAANRAVQAANEELERRVEERTRELREAQDELLKKERLSALGQLTATVAHELRNPLSAIRNTAYAIRETAGPDALRFERPLARLERSILRCENLISDLLHFTRPKDVKRTPVAFDRWLVEILDEQRIPDGIALERRLGAGRALVALDAERFQRVIINLLENAVQAIDGSATPSAARRIGIATSASETLEIMITDSGPGIPAEILPRIFEPLFSTKSFGTGLGLPTVKQIVEQHGGTIAITSVAGDGARVAIRLPLADPQAAVA
ncbi:MAG TPA: ATP-binding protein [Stellaceae bacterium]|nr:ATP-binding protein [Stellaceae bacterium]